MYRVGTLTDSEGGVLLQGDAVARTVSIRDSHVELVPGKRVIVSDLGQGNNQLAIVRTLGVGTPPPPPVALDITTGFSDIIAQLAEATSWTAAWVKTVRYSLTHFDSVVPGITGTAYATLFRAPEDWRLMLPIEFQASPGTTLGASLVNMVVEGDVVRQEQPARIVGPGRTLQDPRNFDYVGIPSTAAVIQGGSIVGYWPNDSARLAGLPGGASVGPDATVSQTIAALFLGPGAVASLLPVVPAEITPLDVYGEPPPGAPDVDVAIVEDRIQRQLFETAVTPVVVFIGASGDYEAVGTPYSEAVQSLLGSLST